MASISSPPSSTTPVARPSFTLMRSMDAVGADLDPRLLRPRAAMAMLMAPVPPREKPQERKAPSISPM